MDGVKQNTVNPLQISQEIVEKYLEGVSDRSRGHYRYSLRMFYSWLPEDKFIYGDSLEQWRDHLQREGYAESTINARLSACNNLMDFLGRRDLQVVRLKLSESEQPELTRAEYLNLLNTAKLLGRDTEYILIKLFGSVGMSLEDVQSLTVEGIEELPLPDFMQGELKGYADRRGLKEGLLFRTRSGKPVCRKQIWAEMKSLCAAAGIAPSKVFPHNLRHLFAVERYKADKDIESLRLDLGHSLLATTQRYLKETVSAHFERVRKRGFRLTE